MLGGYPKHRAEPWVPLYQRAIPSFMHNALVRPLADALPYNARRLQILGRAFGERDATMRLRTWFGSASSSDRRLLGWDGMVQPPDDFPIALAHASPLRRMLYFDQMSWLPEQPSRTRRPQDDGRLRRRPHAIHGHGTRGHRRANSRSAAGGMARRASACCARPCVMFFRNAFSIATRMAFACRIHAWFRDGYRDVSA